MTNPPAPPTPPPIPLVETRQTKVEVLASFTPVQVMRRILDETRPPLECPEREIFPAAVLFTDISGFSKLADRLSKEKGHEGVEQLNRIINRYFELMIRTITDWGGDVIKFSGDAILAIWATNYDLNESLADATNRAARCGKELLGKKPEQDERYHVDGKPVDLKVHIGLGAGEVVAMHAGGVGERCEFVVGGPTLSQITKAESLAEPGQLIMSPEAWELIKHTAKGIPVKESSPDKPRLRPHVRAVGPTSPTAVPVVSSSMMASTPSLSLGANLFNPNTSLSSRSTASEASPVRNRRSKSANPKAASRMLSSPPPFSEGDVSDGDGSQESGSSLRHGEGDSSLTGGEAVPVPKSPDTTGKVVSPKSPKSPKSPGSGHDDSDDDLSDDGASLSSRAASPSPDVPKVVLVPPTGAALSSKAAAAAAAAAAADDQEEGGDGTPRKESDDSTGTQNLLHSTSTTEMSTVTADDISSQGSPLMQHHRRPSCPAPLPAVTLTGPEDSPLPPSSPAAASPPTSPTQSVRSNFNNSWGPQSAAAHAAGHRLHYSYSRRPIPPSVMPASAAPLARKDRKPDIVYFTAVPDTDRAASPTQSRSRTGSLLGRRRAGSTAKSPRSGGPATGHFIPPAAAAAIANATGTGSIGTRPSSVSSMASVSGNDLLEAQFFTPDQPPAPMPTAAGNALAAVPERQRVVSFGFNASLFNQSAMSEHSSTAALSSTSGSANEERNGSVASNPAWRRSKAGIATDGYMAHNFSDCYVRLQFMLGQPPRAIENPRTVSVRLLEAVADPKRKADIEMRLRRYSPTPMRNRIEKGLVNQYLADLRRVTIIFVRLDGLDYTQDDGIHKLQGAMCAIQESLEQFEGAVSRLQIDDKGTILKAAFGLPPRAHEDDAARALLATLDMRDKIMALGLKAYMGLASNLVFCGMVGSSVFREYTTVGSSVNLAARMMQAAGKSKDSSECPILCEGVTHEIARSRVKFEFYDEIKVKGWVEKKAVYRPVGPIVKASSKKGELFGREAEKVFYHDKLYDLVDRKMSGVFVLEGDPGMGKSRLLRHFYDFALANYRPSQLTALYSSADGIHSTVFLHAWRRVFRQLLGRRVDDTASASAAVSGVSVRNFPSSRMNSAARMSSSGVDDDAADSPQTAPGASLRSHALTTSTIQNRVLPAIRHRGIKILTDDIVMGTPLSEVDARSVRFGPTSPATPTNLGEAVLRARSLSATSVISKDSAAADEGSSIGDNSPRLRATKSENHTRSSRDATSSSGISSGISSSRNGSVSPATSRSLRITEPSSDAETGSTGGGSGRLVGGRPRPVSVSIGSASSLGGRTRSSTVTGNVIRTPVLPSALASDGGPSGQTPPTESSLSHDDAPDSGMGRVATDPAQLLPLLNALRLGSHAQFPENEFIAGLSARARGTLTHDLLYAILTSCPGGASNMPSTPASPRVHRKSSAASTPPPSQLGTSPGTGGSGSGSGTGSGGRGLETVGSAVMGTPGASGTGCEGDDVPPVVLFMDNIQYLDSASLALLRSMCKCTSPPTLVVMTMRPPELEEASAGLVSVLDTPGMMRIRMDPLKPIDVHAIVMRVLGAKRLPKPLEAMVEERAQGNPLIAEELATALKESSAVELDGNGALRMQASFRTDSLPTSLQAIILSRVDQMSLSQQMTVKVASVIGRRFTQSQLLAVYPKEDAVADQQELAEVVASDLDALVAAGLLVREASENDNEGDMDQAGTFGNSASPVGVHVLRTRTLTASGNGSPQAKESKGSPVAALRQQGARSTSMSSRGSDGGHNDASFYFKLPITQEVCYNSTLFAQRRELHKRLARWYQSQFVGDFTNYHPTIADHYLKAGDMELASEYYEKAGSAAMHNFANTEAIRFFQLALETIEKTNPDDEASSRKILEKRARWHYSVAEAFMAVGSLDRARASLELALELINLPTAKESKKGIAKRLFSGIRRKSKDTGRVPPQGLVPSPTGSGSERSNDGSTKSSLDSKGSVKSKIALAGSSATRAFNKSARTYEMLTQIYMSAQRTLDARLCNTKAIQHAKQEVPAGKAVSADLVQSYANACLIEFAMGEREKAEQYARKASENAQRFRNVQVRVLYTVSVYYISLCAWQQATDAIMEALEEAKDHGDDMRFSQCRMMMAYISLYHHGSLKAGQQHFALAASGARDRSDRLQEASALAGETLCCLQLRDYVNAEIAIKSVQTLLSGIGSGIDVTLELLCLALRARISLYKRDYEKARRLADELQGRLVDRPTSVQIIEVYSAVAEVYLGLWDCALNTTGKLTSSGGGGGGGGGSLSPSSAGGPPTGRRKSSSGRSVGYPIEQMGRRARDAVKDLQKLANVFPMAKPVSLLWNGRLQALSPTVHWKKAYKTWLAAQQSATTLGLPYLDAMADLFMAQTLPKENDNRKSVALQAARKFEMMEAMSWVQVCEKL